MGLRSIVNMRPGEAREVHSDHWSDEPLVRPEDDLKINERLAEIYDRPYEQMLKDKKHLMLFLGITGGALLLSLGLNGYLVTLPRERNNWIVADPISGDYHVVTKTTTDVPHVVMKEELPDVGRAAFAATTGNAENQAWADYRSTKFVADAARWWEGWNNSHQDKGVFRTVATKHPKHIKGMSWNVKYNVEEFAGKSAIPMRRYTMDCNVTFEFRMPAWGNIFGDESGLFVPGLLCTEEQTEK